MFPSLGFTFGSYSKTIMNEPPKDSAEILTKNLMKIMGLQMLLMGVAILLSYYLSFTGLIQLNDKHPDTFSKDLVEYMEMIGEQIGLAVKNSLIYTKQITTDTLTNVLNRRGLFNDINLIAQLSYVWKKVCIRGDFVINYPS